MDELVEPTVGQGRIEARLGPFDGTIPEGVELFGGVVGGRAEIPVGVGVPVCGVPGRAERGTAELGAEALLLDAREVFEQAAEGQRGSAEVGPQPR
jgi:hypothetical protein